MPRRAACGIRSCARITGHRAGPVLGTVGGMSFTGDSSIAARVAAVHRDYTARQTRLFVRFALIEGAILLLGAVLIFGLQVVDPDIGVWFLVAVAVIGGFRAGRRRSLRRGARTRSSDPGLPDTVSEPAGHGFGDRRRHAGGQDGCRGVPPPASEAVLGMTR